MRDGGNEPPHRNQYRFVGDNQSVFVRAISNEIARLVPFHFRSWRAVTRDYKLGLYPLIKHYFDLDSYRGTEEWEGIKLGIQAECAKAYKDWKRKAKEHFELIGGYENTEVARTNPPDGVSPKAWVHLIDTVYLDPKYRECCLKTKQNQAKQHYKSSHGFQSYAQMRYLNEKKQEIQVILRCGEGRIAKKDVDGRTI